MKCNRIFITTYDEETEVMRTENVEVDDLNKPSKDQQIDMFRQMLECFLDIGCINAKSKVNETIMNTTDVNVILPYQLPKCPYR